MAITITKVDAGQPTNGSATAVAGGSLAADTTYYYRVIGVKRIDNLVITSEPSAEFSDTTTDTNKQINLAWTAGANNDAWIIQRTTTSGVYNVRGGNTLAVSGQPYPSHPCAINTNSFTDDGSAGYSFSNPNPDFTQPFSTIDVSSDSNDDVYLYHIYNEDQTQGWNIFKALVPNSIAVDTYYKTSCGFHLFGNLHVENCIFHVHQPFYLWGKLCTESTTELQIISYYNKPCIITSPMYIIVVYDSGLSYQTSYISVDKLYGADGSTINYLVQRSEEYWARHPYFTYSHSHSGVRNASVSNSSFEDSIGDGTYSNLWTMGALNANTSNTVIEKCETKGSCYFNYGTNVVMKDIVLKSGTPTYIIGYSMSHGLMLNRRWGEGYSEPASGATYYLHTSNPDGDKSLTFGCL